MQPEKRYRTLWACALVSTLLLLGVSRADPTRAGLLIAGRGSITTTGKTARTLKVKDPVFTADVIETGRRTKGQILFADKSVLGLGANSKVVIRDYVFDAQAKTGKLEVEVKQGAFRMLGGALSKGKEWRVQVKTPVATCGIRGSLFSGVYDPQTNTLFVMVLHGAMKLEVDGEIQVVSKPMMGFVIQNGKVVRGPAPMSGSALRSMSQAAGGGTAPQTVDTGDATDEVFDAQELLDLFDNQQGETQQTLEELRTPPTSEIVNPLPTPAPTPTPPGGGGGSTTPPA